MNINEYFGIGDYHGLGYYKGIVSASLPENHDNGEVPPEERDQEYYAEKYAARFRYIWSMIEHGELKFDSKREENDAWDAMLDAMNRYKERAKRFSFIKKHGRDMTDEEFFIENGHPRRSA